MTSLADSRPGDAGSLFGGGNAAERIVSVLSEFQPDNQV
jgi:hypothetical protein